MRTRTALLLVAALPVTAAAAATALSAGRWELRADRHDITLAATPKPNCPRCHGSGFEPSDPHHDQMPATAGGTAGHCASGSCP
ncbi:hypothetical protein [Streptomyces sp. NPDC047803]|uniref:hypothetical protein n=1 Tax=unclassified Streptomyces TaxID=2593676 RepID=UPI0033D91E60